jgi:hypothetical protein
MGAYYFECDEGGKERNFGIGFNNILRTLIIYNAPFAFIGNCPSTNLSLLEYRK